MGTDDSIPVDEALEGGSGSAREDPGGHRLRYHSLTVALLAALIFLGCIVSPPSLMDDMDSVQAQIARTMLQSGDWITPRLDGVAYLEKAPLKYWLIAASFAVFGVHDWAARIPIALSAVLLCWLTARFGAWAFGIRAGTYAGAGLATCVGLFLFTRVLITDVLLTLTVTAAIWGWLRAMDAAGPHPARWALLPWASIGLGVLVKGLIGAVFPIASLVLYLAWSGQLFQPMTWRRLMPGRGLLLALAIAAPWHVLAALRNPPVFDFTLHAGRGAYHGFLWFYFINEHLLRYLNLRYPRDYNTVPRGLFWLYHLIWLFPWSAYLPAVFAHRRDGVGLRLSRASRTRLMALCWSGFVLIFFTLSTSQEYYSMPCYPALALLLGAAIAKGGLWVRRGTKALAVAASLAFLIAISVLWMVRNTPAPGDISAALQAQNPEAYTLSLAHIADLTLPAFAYLRAPLAIAGCALLIGAIACWRRRPGAPVAALAVAMLIFSHASRLALVKFDPYLSSRALAEALVTSPPGELIVDDQYYTFSSVFFYSNRGALLLNGRVNNLEYGSYAPNAPRALFINDSAFQTLWRSAQRFYLTFEGPQLQRFQQLAGKDRLRVIAASGGKFLVTNN